MNNVIINTEDIKLPSWSGSMCSFAQKVLDELNHDNWELSILLCGDNTITQLNAKYRNKNEPTDILSFNLGSKIQDGKRTIFFPGDIVISLDTLHENAKYFKTSEDEELRRLVIHGILHLNGMDHESLDENEPMLVKQEEIMEKLKKEHIIPHIKKGFTEEKSEKHLPA